MTSDQAHPKQEKFCLEYLKCGNASEAYRLAYNAGKMKPESVNRKAKELIDNGKIASRLADVRDRQVLYLFETTSVPVDSQTMAALIAHFGDVDGAKLWASNVLRKAAVRVGAPMQSVARGSISGNTRYSVLARAGFKCQACGAKPGKHNEVTLHVDHILPFSLGGRDDPGNLQSLCRECNVSKGNRFVEDHNEGWNDCHEGGE